MQQTPVNLSSEKSAVKDYGFIIPAIDVIDGKAVRLTQGDYSQKKIYNEHPLEVAKQFAGLCLFLNRRQNQ